MNRVKKLRNPLKNINFDPLLELKLWYLEDQGTVVTTSPADHQTGLQKVMINPKERVHPVQANPQIPAVIKQVTGLKEAAMEVEQTEDKKAHHLKDANLIQEDLILLVIVRQDVLQVEVHLIALNQIVMIGLKEVLVTILQAKKEVTNQEVHHIPADRHLTIDLKEALMPILQVRRKALNQEVHHTQADQPLMIVPKEVLVVNLQEKGKALNQGVRLTLAGQLLTTDLKEALAANPQAKGNFLISQVSKVLRVRVIENSTDARQKVRDLKNVLTIRLTSHSANQKIHPIINLQLSATRMQNRCAAEKNQPLKMILA